VNKVTPKLPGNYQTKLNSLPKLLYSYDALEPFIDAKTMEIHYLKHHQAYVDKLNAALEKHLALFEKPLDSLLKEIDLVPEDIRLAVKNHGGGHANHSLFWKLMTPDKKKREFKGKIADAINKKFGSFDKFLPGFYPAACCGNF